MSNAPILESIAFQKESVLFAELCIHFNEFKGMSVSQIPDSPIAQTLSAVVKHHTGLTVAFNLGEMFPSVDVPNINKNNVLITSYQRNFLSSTDGLKMISDASSVVRGSVNINTGMVSGIFTEVLSTINLPVDMLAGSTYTAEEMAAITLHEIGHLFTYYEYMSRSMTNNQMLAGLAKGLDKSDTAEQREVVLINVKKSMNLTDLDAKTLSKSKDKEVIEIVVISNLAKESKSQLGSDIYDYSTWEFLADQYAARHGAGRHLATGLEKLYKGNWNISFRSTPSYLAMEGLKAFLVIAPIALAIMGTAGMGFAVMIGAGLMAMDADNPTYDRPGERLKRIRDQVVTNLKDKKLSKNEVANLEADLVAIDIVLNDANDRRQWIGAVYDVVSSSGRKARSQELLQKELEDIAVNELFVKAAQLQNL